MSPPDPREGAGHSLELESQEVRLQAEHLADTLGGGVSGL